MWALAGQLLTFVLGLFGFGKPDRIARGESLGKSETTAANALQELSDVKKASDARAAVPADGSGVLDDPDNAGPTIRH